MDVTQRLADPRLSSVLDRLGFAEVDRTEILAARTAMLADVADRERLAEAVTRILALDGDFLAESAFRPEDAEHPLGYGVPLLLAFLATYDEAVSWRQNQPVELVDVSLADLAQQVRVSRSVHGHLCLHAYDWVQGNWAGGLVRLGRLQFNVERMWLDLPDCPEGTLSFFVHIPEGGPMRPDDITASLERAQQVMPTLYPQAAGSPFHCASWLLDPTIVEIFGPDSNVGRFAARFTPPLAMEPNDRDPLYYAFRVEPPVDRATLPRDSRVHTGILEHYDAGGAFYTAMRRWVG